jgi:diaminohydroxyphosphoribosylaminopyrimidine deaminase/5-amino-6-(5-phosphoribosylamino)uracil reductase
VRPRVTLKLATSLDSRIATAAGESRWITGPEARAQVHKLRGEHDAVMVGSETALADDPELSVRTDPPPPRQPLRVVLDSRLRIAPDCRLLKTIALAPVTIFAASDAEPERRGRLEAAGAQVLLAPRAGAGLDLAAVLEVLRQAGAGTIFLEGGGRLACSFMDQGFIDRLEWFRAPIVLGAEGRAAIGPIAPRQLAAAPRFRRTGLRLLGEDVWETLERS